MTTKREIAQLRGIIQGKNRCAAGMAAAALLLISGLLPTLHAAYSIQGLGWLGTYEGAKSSLAYDISGDGTTVVGQSSSSNGNAEAFKWVAGTGMSGLGDLAGGTFASVAYGVNSDGSVIVGKGTTTGSSGADLIQSFQYTSAGGMVGLGAWVADKPNTAYAVDPSGSTIVGEASNGSWTRATRYDGGAWSDLGSLTGASYGNGTARAIIAPSGGDTVIVGGSDTLVGINLRQHAFRKVASAQMEDLGTLGTDDDASRATDLTADGSIIVGHSTHVVNGEIVYEAFRWDAASSMVGLGDLGNNDGVADDYSSKAFGVSADGQVIVGRGQTGLSEEGETSYEAFVYFTATGEMKLLSAVLAANGVDMSGWQQLLEAQAVSDDGTKIVGTGITSDGEKQAFLATIEVPVPEPEFYGLAVGSALLGLIFWRRHPKA